MIARRLYAAAATLAAPALKPWLRRRARRGKEDSARLAERWAGSPAMRPPGPLLWLHAASVGETVSVLPVLQVLGNDPGAPSVLFTTGTVSSASLLAERLPALGLAGRVTHCFAPLDVPAWVARFLTQWQPDAACFVEQEVWPNTLAALSRRRIPALLLNARLSARSAAAWRRAPALARACFGSFTAIRAQSEADADRLAGLGGRCVSAPGNLKRAALPLSADATELARLGTLLADRPAWLAASTHPGEEAMVIAAHDALAIGRPNLLTIIAPRHPARGGAVAELAAGRAVARRSVGADPPALDGIWLADTMGELGLLYRLAPIVFVGGSLVPHGGQNLLEPARLGCALASGPHTANFAESARALAEADALTTVSDAASLASWAGDMLDDPARRATAGAAAALVARPDPALAADAATALIELVAARADR